MRQAIIFTITVMMIAGQTFSQAGSWSAQSSVEALGVTEGNLITNGFVFIDGKYIEPPYIVTRRGNGIFINGHLVEQPCPWPIPHRPELMVPAEDPKMPETITDKSSMYDTDLVEYMAKKRAYHANRVHGKEFADVMVRAYAELPCVQDARPGRDFNHVDVTWGNGQVDHIRIVPFTHKPTEWTRETVLARADEDRAKYEDRLNRGDYYFLGSTHGRITGTSEGARKLLVTLLPILRASKDAQEVQQKLQQSGISFMDEGTCEAFFKNRTDSAELDERINDLRP